VAVSQKFAVQVTAVASSEPAVNNRSMQLTPSQQAFVQAQVANGVYSTPDEVVQAGIELLRQQASLGERDAAIADVQDGVRAYEQGQGESVARAFSSIRQELGHRELDFPS
jgi:putative addiction module CopG family antidote